MSATDQQPKRKPPGKPGPQAPADQSTTDEKGVPAADPFARSIADGPTSLGFRSSLDVKRVADDLLVGKQFGPYEVLAEIARGGMGVVYKARHVELNRVVALKMILAGPMATKTQRLRFRAEAEAAAMLDHPGIVPIYDVGELHGNLFLAMAFIEGPSLARVLKSRPLEPREAAMVAQQVADAIGFAHTQGVIHRDIKPANILLQGFKDPSTARTVRPSGDSTQHRTDTKSLLAKVTDFGLAKRFEESDGLTKTGQVVGTPSFMPPEQANGQIHLLGPETDVYAIGATLYASLSGRAPVDSTAFGNGTLKSSATDALPLRSLVPDVDRDLETICHKCLDPDPRRRYPTGTALADDLGRWLAGEPIRARPLPLTDRMIRWFGRRRLWIGIILGGLFCLALGFVIAALTGPKPLHPYELDKNRQPRKGAPGDRGFGEPGPNDRGPNDRPDFERKGREGEPPPDGMEPDDPEFDEFGPEHKRRPPPKNRRGPMHKDGFDRKDGPDRNNGPMRKGDPDHKGPPPDPPPPFDG